MQRISASFAVGQNCPVSMELMVLRDTPTIFAKSDWDKSFSARATFSLFFSIKSSLIISYPKSVHVLTRSTLEQKY